MLKTCAIDHSANWPYIAPPGPRLPYDSNRPRCEERGRNGDAFFVFRIIRSKMEYVSLSSCLSHRWGSANSTWAASLTERRTFSWMRRCWIRSSTPRRRATRSCSRRSTRRSAPSSRRCPRLPRRIKQSTTHSRISTLRPPSSRPSPRRALILLCTMLRLAPTRISSRTRKSTESVKDEVAQKAARTAQTSTLYVAVAPRGPRITRERNWKRKMLLAANEENLLHRQERGQPIALRTVDSADPPLFILSIPRPLLHSYTSPPIR